jgi:hypothetical protein
MLTETGSKRKTEIEVTQAALGGVALTKGIALRINGRGREDRSPLARAKRC